MGKAGADRGGHQSGLGSGNGIKELLSLASAFKEGDLLVGGTTDEHVRADARRALSGATVGEIRRAIYVNDGVSAALERSRDRRFDAELDPLTVGGLKTILLGRDLPVWASTYRDSLASEVIAAVAKVMTDDELSSVAARLFNPPSRDALRRDKSQSHGQHITIGSPQHFGSRIQPNSAGDDESEILFSILDGLTYGCGDVIIGLNPAADEIDTIVRLEQLLERVVRTLDLPTRYCVLSDIVKQHRARTRARIDVAFQSLAGTSRGLVGMVGLDVDGILDLARDFDALYFETGQGSEVTNGAAEGLDMVTLEARTYGVARYLKRATGCAWTIVNDVAGFIGPEVFRTAAQLERACLEDAVMAKLHGLTMGLDVCATFHMGIAPRELREVTERIVLRAAPAYLMAVAGNADPMLGYLTTSFREHPFLRARAGRRMTSAMEQRLIALGAVTPDGAMRPGPASIVRLATLFGLDGMRRLMELDERGLDLNLDPEAAQRRLDGIYEHARRALYATIEDHVIRDASLQHVRARTTAATRDDYLAHPSAGERLCADDVHALTALGRERHPQVQIVISDGLNADAINEQLRHVLPPVRRLLSSAGSHVAATDIVVQNGRVRVGYQIGGLVSADVVVHFIGERPGTGLNTMSAYLTYGRNADGQPRWNSELDHSATNAICGIHPRGKPPENATTEIARTVARILEQRQSGVALPSSDPTP